MRSVPGVMVRKLDGEVVVEQAPAASASPVKPRLANRLIVDP